MQPLIFRGWEIRIFQMPLVSQTVHVHSTYFTQVPFLYVCFWAHPPSPLCADFINGGPISYERPSRILFTPQARGMSASAGKTRRHRRRRRTFIRSNNSLMESWVLKADEISSPRNGAGMLRSLYKFSEGGRTWMSATFCHWNTNGICCTLTTFLRVFIFD